MAELLDEAFAGKKGLVTGIANEQSIAYGCARAFRRLGAEVAVTYLNDKAKPYVEPLARELEASMFTPLDVRVGGSMEGVFERIADNWGGSISSSIRWPLRSRRTSMAASLTACVKAFCWPWMCRATPSFAWPGWRSRS
jgi:NAD(P)-dependent dehydrogenase (short-subunit alcohol dehydrogenase family)